MIPVVIPVLVAIAVMFVPAAVMAAIMILDDAAREAYGKERQTDSRDNTGKHALLLHLLIDPGFKDMSVAARLFKTRAAL